MTGESYLFYTLIPLVAFFYASVGHGGASGYLALMALFSFPNDMMKQTALLLNLFVAGIAFFQYYKARGPRPSLMPSLQSQEVSISFSIVAGQNIPSNVLGPSFGDEGFVRKASSCET